MNNEESLRSCRDCKWCRYQGADFVMFCVHANAELEGRHKYHLGEAGRDTVYRTCENMRGVEGFCGKKASLFEPEEKPTPADDWPTTETPQNWGSGGLK